MAPASRQERGGGSAVARRLFTTGPAAAADLPGAALLRSWGSVRGLFMDGPVRVAWEKEGGGIFTKIHIQLCPAWEGLFAIFASAIDLTMDVPRWLCAFVHQLRLVHQIQSQSGSPHFGV
jgi:hypothetical protein